MRLKLLLPPNVWFHGSQSIRTGGSTLWLGVAAFIMAWFEVIMRWVLMTPLGAPVEPEVNRSLAIVSGPTLACALSTWAVGLAARSASSGDERRDAGRLARATTSTSLAMTAS